MKLNWYYIGLAVVLYIIGQTAVWFQHNWQFKDPTKSPTWWGWYVMAIPLTWVFLQATKVGVEGFGGNLWPNRFIGFVVGMVSYIFLTSYFFNEHLTPKISVQLVLCFLILMVQLLWKN
jgi:hypothetical protein